MTEKLKPCPFCGSKRLTVWAEGDYLDGEEIILIAVSCDVNLGGCGATSGFKKDKVEAIKAWNMRTEPDQVEFSPEWLKEARSKAGLSKNELGRRIGVSSTSIRKWESGQCRPKELVLRKLKEELGGDTD